jgi:hypothetical protein
VHGVTLRHRLCRVLGRRGWGGRGSRWSPRLRGSLLRAGCSSLGCGWRGLRHRGRRTRGIRGCRRLRPDGCGNRQGNRKSRPAQKVIHDFDLPIMATQANAPPKGGSLGEVLSPSKRLIGDFVHAGTLRVARSLIMDSVTVDGGARTPIFKACLAPTGVFDDAPEERALSQRAKW